MISGVEPARIIGVLIALVVCAWFGLGIRQTQETTKAAAIASGTAPLTTSSALRAIWAVHQVVAMNASARLTSIPDDSRPKTTSTRSVSPLRPA